MSPAGHICTCDMLVEMVVHDAGETCDVHGELGRARWEALEAAARMPLLIGPEAREAAERALNDHCSESDWQKLRPGEMAGVVLDAAVIEVKRRDGPEREALEELLRHPGDRLAVWVDFIREALGLDRLGADDPLREESPERLVAFLYLLMRDRLPTGQVSRTITEAGEASPPEAYSAPELEELARRYARMLDDRP